MLDDRLKYNLLSGVCTEGEFQEEFIAGRGFLFGGDDFYVLKLNMFPRCTYFMRKNQMNDNYTIFSNKKNDPSGTFLRDPVGYGSFRQGNNTLMKLKFHLTDTVVYMDLYTCQ